MTQYHLSLMTVLIMNSDLHLTMAKLNVYSVPSKDEVLQQRYICEQASMILS